MTYIWAAILGAVQGLAEFLPISSTAHLKLVPWAAQLTEGFLYSIRFDIALHAGSFVAVLVALWADWMGLLKGAVARDRKSIAFLGYLLLTSVPGALAGLFLEDYVEYFSTPPNPSMPPSDTFLYAPLIVGVALIVFGVLLDFVDRYARREDPLEKMTWQRALLIGVAQALALIPGVSRSGATMTAGRALGISREATARYSFLAALPIIGGATVFGLRDVPLSMLLSPGWVLGFVASLIASFAAMRWMLDYVRRHSFRIFAVYRVVLGVVVIAVFFLRG